MRDINETESKWLETVLVPDFQGKDVIQNQLLSSKVEANYNSGFISLKFKVSHRIGKFNFDVRVPVEMRAFQTDDVPYVFLLHIVEGYVDELEVFKADSSEILLPPDIDLSKVEYEITSALKQ